MIYKVVEFIVAAVSVFWFHIVDDPISFILMIVAVASAVSAIVYSKIANQKALEANRLAEAANRISEHSNKVTERLSRHQIINDLFREYRSQDMGQAVRKLWQLNPDGLADPETTAEWYRLELEKEHKEHNDGQMDGHRRKVTQFYIQLSIESYNDLVFREVLYSIWFKGDLAIIPLVLLPIDEIIVQRKPGMPPFSQIHIQNQRLFQLWNLAPEVQAKKPV